MGGKHTFRKVELGTALFECDKCGILVKDYGRAKMKDSIGDENSNEDLYSLGPGLILEVGEHFNGAIYYGYPLEATSTTKTGDGRLNISLMMRW